MLTTQRSQHETAIANIEVAKLERDKTISAFAAYDDEKLAEAERKADDLAQKQAKGQLRLDHLALRSPIVGTVNGLTVRTVGQ